MSKADYRQFFAYCIPFLKMKYFCKLAGVSNVNLSRFMKGSEWDYELSIESCNKLANTIIQYIDNIEKIV